MKNRKRTRPKNFRLDHCSPEDFDGHNDWNRLTFEQKLDWLARAARFVLAHQPKSGTSKSQTRARGLIGPKSKGGRKS